MGLILALLFLNQSVTTEQSRAAAREIPRLAGESARLRDDYSLGLNRRWHANPRPSPHDRTGHPGG